MHNLHNNDNYDDTNCGYYEKRGHANNDIDIDRQSVISRSGGRGGERWRRDRLNNTAVREALLNKYR